MIPSILLFLLACFDPNVPASDDDTEFVFEVPEGATANAIHPDLVEAGLAPDGLAWKLYTRNNDVSCLKAGKFALRKNMSLNEAFEVLCGVPLADDKPFTVLEGWRIRDIDAALAEEGWIEAGAYKAVAEGKTVDAPFDVSSPTYEGYLWPETYMLSESQFNVEQFVERQLQTFHDNFVSTHDDLGERSLHEVVVMASMLEREEPKPAQRPMVAGILWKRIDNGWQLGVDATSRYTLDVWNDRKSFLKKLRDPDDPYNTRIHKGLPPTAIGNPSLPSLEAAIDPVASEYWFYLHDAEKILRPARNAEEHEANRRRYNVY